MMEANNTPQQLNRDWLTVKQTADYLGCSVQTIMNYLRQGKLKGTQIVAGGKWKISSSSIEKLMTRK